MAEGESRVVAIRNFLALSMVAGLSLFTLFYLMGTGLIAFLRGMEYTRGILQTPNLYIQLNTFVLEFQRQWLFIFQNLATIQQYPIYLLQVISATFLPPIIYITLIYKFRVEIFEWKAFVKEEKQYGDAHWMTAKEITKAGLRLKKGMLMGMYKKKYLIEHTYQHTLLFAPTGSGKGVGFVIPNLLFWEESVIVHDIKLENYELTSGFRFKVLKQKVFLWNPADQQGITHCYNPMDWVSKSFGAMADDIQKIGNFLLPASKGDFWINEGRAIAVGVMLLLYADEAKTKSMGEALRVLKSDDISYNLAVALDTFGAKMHPVAYMNISAFLGKPDTERGSVNSTANSALELWSNPFVDAATSKSHFNLGKFREIPHTLYVGISPNNIDRLRPVLQIFYSQCATIFTNKMPDKKKEKFGVMMLLDEFPTLGKLEEIKAGIAYYRGYMVKLFLIVQDTEQLKGIYDASGMNSFLSNSTYRVTFSANNTDTAKLISDLLGTKTVEVESGKKAKFIDFNPGAKDVSISKQGRALLLPQEVINLPRDEEIILMESKGSIKCNKIFYYKDPLFMKRLLGKTFVPTQEPYDPRKHGPKAGAGGNVTGGHAEKASAKKT